MNKIENIKKTTIKNINQKASERFFEKWVVKLFIPGQGNSWGSGFLVAPDLIVTCYHVIKNTNYVNVQNTFYNFQSQARVKDIEPTHDLALLQLEKVFLKELDNLKVGRTCRSRDPLYSYGYPDNFPEGAPVTAECEGFAIENGVSLIKFKAGEIRPGLSGSPLYNQRTKQICGVIKFTRSRDTDLGGGAISFQSFPKRWSQYFSFDWGNFDFLVSQINRIANHKIIYTIIVLFFVIANLVFVSFIKNLILQTTPPLNTQNEISSDDPFTNTPDRRFDPTIVGDGFAKIEER